MDVGGTTLFEKTTDKPQLMREMTRGTVGATHSTVRSPSSKPSMCQSASGYLMMMSGLRRYRREEDVGGGVHVGPAGVKRSNSCFLFTYT